MHMSLSELLKNTSERPISLAVFHVGDFCLLTKYCGFAQVLEACKSSSVNESLSVPGPKRLIQIMQKMKNRFLSSYCLPDNVVMDTIFSYIQCLKMIKKKSQLKKQTINCAQAYGEVLRREKKGIKQNVPLAPLARTTAQQARESQRVRTNGTKARSK